MFRNSIVRMIRSRLLQTIPVLFIATFIVFGLLQLLPGDIAVTLAGENATDQRLAEIRSQYGLDQPFLVQYGAWLWNAVRGDFSQSLLSGEPVSETILRVFPNTLLVVALAMVMSIAVGVPLGIAAASRPGTVLDKGINIFVSIAVAVPNFWAAMVLVAILAIRYRLLPASGSAGFLASPLEALRYALMPAIAIALGSAAEIARQMRSALLDVLSSQHVRTLRARGVSPKVILWRHGLKNVGVTMLTVISLLANRMLAATVVVEAVFAIPGMGSVIVRAAIQRDFPVVQGVVMTMVLTVILINLIADVLSAVVDPRIRT